jgi:ribosomal protein S18 acetylase RimI-like enzyme
VPDHSNSQLEFTVRVLNTDDAIAAAFPLMRCLREHLTADTFVATVRGQQRGGYVLAGGFVEASAAPVALAGFRVSQTLSRGPHLFVDDLVTDSARQGMGYGTAMVDWLRAEAFRLGLPWVWLDSRATAKGFYERVGFEFQTAIPCRIPSAPSGV